MQNIINKRSAVARPPRKTLVGVAGNGLSRGQRVEVMIMTFPERNYELLIVRIIFFETFWKDFAILRGSSEKSNKDLKFLINLPCR